MREASSGLFINFYITLLFCVEVCEREKENGKSKVMKKC